MLAELRTLIAVSQYGTFSAAGARIGLTQSAVSAQMQRLEDELGFALFDRTGRSATLNDAGRETLALAEEIIALYARLSERGALAAESGMLRVGAIASAQVSFLADALARFREDRPGWRIRVVPGVSLNLLGQVDSGELDLAVIIKPPFALPSELEWRTLVTEPFVLLVPKALARGKRSWRELLKSEPFIRYDRTSFGGRLVDRFLRRARLNVHEVLELDELQAIVQLVARGIGIALIPDTAGLGKWPAGVSALSLDEATFHREIGLVQRPRHSRQAVAAALADCIGSAAQA
ncbi:LysR family transcriptional regulator [Paraburkholderia phenoliruptrix]|uniref:LysR family transcriptional regulator n=2 Tax=Paraburkholderia phenoliruptrix TaxID=252970 RepID=K0E106_9BURK|nr:LysR family transcriptional regulator [Paraburkholderia phenoliruptrix]AFT89304.1 LysR family transcriptional regulator [Paraburkholderia phenoliruptrix BR3459a]MDR6422041.1 DNA-binding transcriptional LysR family regulator [Paraburkholderia phenoliruptrix]CAB4050755.1 HTH-type transcriptional activator CmpR [Paraburkholderia phenoliruptrix]